MFHKKCYTFSHYSKELVQASIFHNKFIFKTNNTFTLHQEYNPNQLDPMCVPEIKWISSIQLEQDLSPPA